MLLALVAVAPILFAPTAHAAVSGTCYFKGGRCGGSGSTGGALCPDNDVFSGRGAGYVSGGSYVCPGKSDIYDVTNRTDFINFIDSRFNGGRNRPGARLVVAEMLGKSGASLTQADLNEWKDLMNDPSVKVSTGVESVGKTSYYDPDRDDVFFANDGSVTRQVILITQNGKPRATIERPCGNLTAGTIPLTKRKFKVTATGSINKRTAKPGESVQWTWVATNKGPDAVPANLDLGSTKNDVVGNARWTKTKSGVARDCTKTSGMGVGGTADCTNSFRIPATAADGTQYCQDFLWRPQTQDDLKSDTLSDLCVTVKKPACVPGVDPACTPPGGGGCTPGDLTCPASTEVCSEISSTTGNDFWNMSARVSTNQDEVQLGGVMKWSHAISNRGPKTTDLPIEWGFGGTYPGGNWSADGLAPGATHTQDSTYAPTQDDVGTTVKRTTWVDPSGRYWSGWSPWTDSSPANVSTSTSAPGTVTTATSETSYRRAYDHTVYSGVYEERTLQPDGTYSAWTRDPSKDWTSTYDQSYAAYIDYSDGSKWKQKRLTSSTNYYRTQESTRTKTPAGRLETGGCGIYVPYDYELEPTISVDPAVAEVENPLSVTGTIHNNGPTKSEPVSWQITQLVFPKGSTPPSNSSPEVDDADACSVYGDGASSCDVLKSGSGSVIPTSLDASVGGTAAVPPVEAGSRVCFALSIHPWRNSYDEDGGHPGDGPSSWKHSVLACTVVARRPKLQVRDGDLMVRGDIVTSTGVRGGKTYGSWVDYGIFLTGTNELAASGGGYNGGGEASTSGVSQLTFANTPRLGGYTLGTFSSPALYFTEQPSNQTAADVVTIPTTPGRHVIKVTAAEVTIRVSGIVPVGDTVIIQAPDSAVTIDDDIAYDTTGSITSIRDIPQVVIVAKDLNIPSTVTRVDSWLMVSGVLQTCPENPSGPLTVDDCNEPLTVNGPVSVGELHARRTAGATASAPEAAAETFRMTPATYLWLNAFTGGDQPRTTYVKELPPRF